MARSKKKTKPRKKKSSAVINFRKVILFFLLTLLVVFSVFTAGYVIFFRTVFAQEIPVSSKKAFIFEEPDPPPHKEMGQEPQEKSSNVEKQLPKVAIIIDDLGYHEQVGNELLNFPFELTYSFLPFAPFTSIQENFAFSSGKIVLLHLPLEPKDLHWDSGPGTLFLTDSPELQKIKFKQDMAAVPHAIGVNNHMGSRYTENQQAMTLLLKEIRKQSLFFIDSFTTAGSVGLQVALELGVPASRRHVFLDNTRSEDKICSQLRKLVKVAGVQSTAIGIAHPYPETYRALKKCVPQYTGKVDFVNVTAIIESY